MYIVIKTLIISPILSCQAEINKVYDHWCWRRDKRVSHPIPYGFFFVALIISTDSRQLVSWVLKQIRNKVRTVNVNQWIECRVSEAFIVYLCIYLYMPCIANAFIIEREREKNHIIILELDVDLHWTWCCSGCKLSLCYLLVQN